MASIYFCVLHDQVIFTKNFRGFSKTADRWLKMAMQSVTALSSYFCHRCVSLEPECPLFNVWCHFHTRLALFLPCSAVATTSLRNDLRYSFHWASGLVQWFCWQRHETLANPQTFGYEFHLRRSPHLMDDRSAGCFISCSYVHRVDEPQPDRNSCTRLQFLASLVWTLPCRYLVKHFTK